MSTLGNTTSPTSGWDNPGSGYEAATSFTTPSGGGILITALHGYFDATSGTPTGYLCVWDNSGNLIASVSVGTLAVGSSSAGGQAWYTASLATPLYVAPSTAIWIGFYSTGTMVFSSESGGSSNVKSIGSGGPGNFAGSSSSGIGGVGAYADCTSAGMHVRRSGAWTAAPVFVRRSGTWVAAPVYIRRSGAWVAAS